MSPADYRRMLDMFRAEQAAAKRRVLSRPEIRARHAEAERDRHNPRRAFTATSASAVAKGRLR